MGIVAAYLAYVDGIGAGRAERLNLSNPAGWQYLRLDLGVRDLEQTKLSQMPYDGDYVADSRRPNRKCRMELLLQPQDDWTDLVALRNSLEQELDRETNILEYRFPYTTGGVVPDSFFIYTERAPIPALLRGQDGPNPARWMRDLPSIVEFEAQPTFVDTNGNPVPF